MKLKSFAFICAVSFTSTAMAQFQGTTVDQRIERTAGEDSVAIGRNHISLFQMSCDSKNWKEAYVSWKWLIKYAPYSITGLYKGNAPFMLYNLITAEQDQAQKEAYFADLMDLFKERQERLEALNSIEKREQLKSTLGDVLAVKAEYYNWTAPGVLGGKFDLKKSYKNFEEAIKAINEGGGREVTGSFLQTFFQVSNAIYSFYENQVKNGMTTSNAWREQYLQDYLDSKEACEKMLTLAKEAQAEGNEAKAQKLVATYEAPLNFIEQTFSASGAADREQIIEIYTKKFESYKSDINKLNSAINLMAQNNCDDAPIYFDYAKAAYDLQPTFNSAIGLAQKAMSDKQAAEALGYYDKALELASSDAQRGRICLQIARALASSGASGKAEEYINKAITFNPDLTGHAYFQMANVLTKAHDLKGALAYCEKAAAADITVANRANQLKEALSKAIEQQANNAKANAEYQEYLRKKKAEEDFWKGGK